MELLDALEDLAQAYDLDRDPVIARSYENIVGVHPEFRKEFRAALERIDNGACGRVQAVIDHYRRLVQLNGVSFD